MARKAKKSSVGYRNPPIHTRFKSGVSGNPKGRPKMDEAVNHPAHYGGEDNPYEVIKVIEAWGLDKDFLLGNTLKYIGRNGKKDPTLQELKKALWYLKRKVTNLEKEEKNAK